MSKRETFIVKAVSNVTLEKFINFAIKHFAISPKQLIRIKEELIELIPVTNKKKVILGITSQELKQFLANEKKLRKISSAGFTLATIEFTQTTPKINLSLAGILFLSKLSVKAKVFVNTFGEQVFLYGKDLFKKSIDKIIKPPKGSKLVFIFNSYGECIGLGKLVKPVSLFKKANANEIIVKNLKDLGIYLRQGY
ncbi:MAG: hypothetical protein ACP6IS_11695 [Candidatus Asgardarchaeia archaeon]